MNAESEILKLIHRYCYAIDAGDFETFGKLLEHAEWTVEGKPPGGSGISNIILYPDGTPRTKHTVSNTTLEVNSVQGTATAHSYVTIFQQTSELPLQPIYAGDYFDEFERVRGLWRFAKRDIRASLIGDMSAHLKNPSATVPGA
jgi:hypothetical protein